MAKTKIVATLGPQSESVEIIEKMIDAGVDVFRINFSHQTHKEQVLRMNIVRRASRRLDKPVAILADLQGPKIRTGRIAEEAKPVILKDGQRFAITTEEVLGDNKRVSTDFRQITTNVGPGDSILINDGKLRLDVDAVVGAEVRCTVCVGGELGERKGINIPGKKISLGSHGSMTDKDRRDLAFSLEQNVDYVALSFVRDAEDVRFLRALIGQANEATPIIAKIETPLAVQNIDEILNECEGIMVARGDMGVELAVEEVPLRQKELIEKAAMKHKLCITATQMLESMIENSTPTRAEASDIANAIFDGTDAIMLSGETAVGKYVVESVATMRRIADMADSSQYVRRFDNQLDPDSVNIALATASAAISACAEAEAAAIVVFTMTGKTALLISKLRPEVPVLALTPEERTCRRLALQNGVTPVLNLWERNALPDIEVGLQRLRSMSMINAGARIVLVSGEIPEAGHSNSIKIVSV